MIFIGPLAYFQLYQDEIRSNDLQVTYYFLINKLRQFARVVRQPHRNDGLRRLRRATAKTDVQS